MEYYCKISDSNNKNGLGRFEKPDVQLFQSGHQIKMKNPYEDNLYLFTQVCFLIIIKKNFGR